MEGQETQTPRQAQQEEERPRPRQLPDPDTDPPTSNHPASHSNEPDIYRPIKLHAVERTTRHQLHRIRSLERSQSPERRNRGFDPKYHKHLHAALPRARRECKCQHRDQCRRQWELPPIHKRINNPSTRL
jgi:hypothetical protein